MKIGHILSLSLLLMAVVVATGSAKASQVLYSDSGFVMGQQSFVESFNISGPGTLTVTLSNVAWPAQLASLNLVMGTAGGLLGPEMGAGSESFNVAGGMVFAQWFGTAQGSLDIGVYSINVAFQPNGVTVPLPSSFALLLGGLALLCWQLRRRGNSPSRFAAAP